MIRNQSIISSYVTKDGSRIWELLHPGSAPIRDISIAEALVEPGQETEAHVHRRSQEVYYILEGSGNMRLGADEKMVSAGDAILITPGTPHMIGNTGAGPLRILCICCPPYAHEDTELERSGSRCTP